MRTKLQNYRAEQETESQRHAGTFVMQLGQSSTYCGQLQVNLWFCRGRARCLRNKYGRRGTWTRQQDEEEGEEDDDNDTAGQHHDLHLTQTDGRPGHMSSSDLAQTSGQRESLFKWLL